MNDAAIPQRQTDFMLERVSDSVSFWRLVESAFWLVSAFLTSITLLCWSALYLFNALTNGPSLEVATNTAANAGPIPTSAVIIWAVSFMGLSRVVGTCQRSSKQA